MHEINAEEGWNGALSIALLIHVLSLPNLNNTSEN